MKIYYCPQCKNSWETSECEHCGIKTIRIDCVGWSKKDNIPIFTRLNTEKLDEKKKEVIDSNLKYLSSDIRPVFPEERLLIELILGCPLKYLNSSCWSTKGGTYIFDGKIIKIKVKELKQLDTKKIRNDYYKYSVENKYDSFNKYAELFVKRNEDRYHQIETEARSKYLEELKNKYDKNSTFVSFSGGKDSTVVSHLVTTTLGDPKVMHIFGDTTLEFPETYEYIKRFKENNRLTPMMNAKNKEKNFYDMCELIGPPSRVMRWCCTVFKTGAIQHFTNTMYKNKVRILTFYGIRRAESTSRSKYDRESDSPKITKQRTVSPIIDWLDGDVWLYILTTKIDFNDAYRLGFARVGCWCCPNNSGWSEFLSEIHHEEEYNRFRKILLNNAKKIGKPDPEEYVDSGAWKAKQGGDGIEYGKRKVVSFEPCALEENAFNYELQKPIDDNLYDLFKPFGELNFDLGNKRLGEVYILDNKKRVILKLQGRVGENKLKVSIINLPIAGAKNIKDARRKVECQITKFQMCLNCSACMSVCKFGAIKITMNGFKLRYKVDETKCVHCFECINHFTAGCYLRKVLATREDK